MPPSSASTPTDRPDARGECSRHDSDAPQSGLMDGLLRDEQNPCAQTLETLLCIVPFAESVLRIGRRLGSGSGPVREVRCDVARSCGGCDRCRCGGVAGGGWVGVVCRVGVGRSGGWSVAGGGCVQRSGVRAVGRAGACGCGRGGGCAAVGWRACRAGAVAVDVRRVGTGRGVGACAAGVSRAVVGRP